MLRRLTDNMRDMVARVDSNHRIVYASPSHKRIVGYDPDELLGKVPLELVHPDDRQMLQDEYLRGIADHVDVRTEYRGICRDGHYVWLETVNSFLYAPDGTFDGAIFSSRDITERKKAETLHRESEERYAALFHRSHDGIYVHDLTGRFLDANDAALALLGYSREEIPAMTFQSLLSGDQMPEAVEAMKEILSDGFQKRKRRFRLIAKNGEVKHVDVLGMMVYRDGKPDAILGIAHDVTGDRLSEEALRDSEAKYRLITDLMSDIVWTMDMNMRYTYISPSVERLHGYTPEELIGASVQTLMQPESFAMASKLMVDELLAEKEGTIDPDRSVMMDLAGRHKDGTVIWMETLAKFIRNVKGEIVGVHGVSRDIGERKRMQDSLAASEEKYRALVESTDTGYVIIDGSGVVMDANREYVRLTGNADLSEILGRNVVEWTAAHDRDRNDEAVRQCFRDGFIRGLEIDYVDRAGRITPIEINATVAGAGAVARIHTLCRDISWRRKAEEESQKNEDRFRAVFDQSPVGIFTYSRDMVFTGTNRQFAFILKSTPEKLIGLDLTRLKETAVIPVLREALQGRVSYYEGPYHATTSDAFRWVRFSVSPLRGADGEVAAGIGVVVDITERKMAEDALRESEERYRGLFDNANDFVFTLDLDMNFTSINRKVMEVTGYTREEALRMKASDIIVPEYMDLAKRMMEKKIADGEPTRYEVEILTRAGERLPLEISTQLIMKEGAPAGIQGIGRDIRERKQMEERIQAALAEKETLLREVHHRVKNNFQAITSLMELQSAGMQSPELRKSFADAQSRIRSMALIHEKLYQSDDLSKIDLSSYIHTIVHELYGSFSSVHTGVDPRVNAGEIRLTVDQAIPCGLIVNELVTNSFKHAFPPGWRGRPEVTVSLQERDGTVELSIGDNGAGLPEAVDLDKTRSLGLSLVPILVRQLGGTILLDRARGTRFDITFPVR